MQSYPVNTDPEQIVRWVIAECEVAPSTLKTLARRTSEVREIPVRREFHLGDEEREELSEVATVATLEIAPTHAADGWVLTVAVEDEVGPRSSQEGQIDLSTAGYTRGHDCGSTPKFGSVRRTRARAARGRGGAGA